MTPALIAATAVAGGLGAALRYLLDTLAARLTTQATRIWAMNIAGSFVAGMLSGVAAQEGALPWIPVLSVGFLGGFTTLSTTTVHAVEMLLERRARRAAMLTLSQLVLGVVLAILGFLLALQW